MDSWPCHLGLPSMGETLKPQRDNCRVSLYPPPFASLGGNINPIALTGYLMLRPPALAIRSNTWPFTLAPSDPRCCGRNRIPAGNRPFNLISPSPRFYGDTLQPRSINCHLSWYPLALASMRKTLKPNGNNWSSNLVPPALASMGGLLYLQSNNRLIKLVPSSSRFCGLDTEAP